MWIRARSAALPKAGNSAEEYEDAYLPASNAETEAWRFRAAVADGATETSFSGEWARQLVAGYASGRLRSANFAWALPALQRRWHSNVSGRPMSWYAQEKLRQGAFSSLIGLTILDSAETSNGDKKRTWNCTAAGDSCVFHLRDTAMVTAFPLSASDEFTSRPRLISSLRPANAELNGTVRVGAGEWLDGDSFVLATDALACWLLSAIESGDDSFAALNTAMAEPRAFIVWVDKLRASRQMRNDDVTALWLDVGSERISASGSEL